MKGKMKEAKLAALKDLIDVMRSEEKKSWGDVLKKDEKPMEKEEESEDEEEVCPNCDDGSCPECKKKPKGGVGIIIAVEGKPKK